MEEFKYPIVLALKNGILKYARFEDDLKKTNTNLLKKGAFENLLIIDSNGIKYNVKNAVKVKPFGLLSGLSPFLYQNINIDLIIDDYTEHLDLEDFKIFFLKMFKNDARLIGGIVSKHDIKYINSANSIYEIIQFFTDSFFRVYPV